MATETIDIQVRDSGSRIVRRNFADLAAAADRAHSSVSLLKQALFGFSIGALVREFVTLADAFTTMQNKIKAAGVETQLLTAVTSELFRVANETRASVEATAS